MSEWDVKKLFFNLFKKTFRQARLLGGYHVDLRVKAGLSLKPRVSSQKCHFR